MIKDKDNINNIISNNITLAFIFCSEKFSFDNLFKFNVVIELIISNPGMIKSI